MHRSPEGNKRVNKSGPLEKRDIKLNKNLTYFSNVSVNRIASQVGIERLVGIDGLATNLRIERGL